MSTKVTISGITGPDRKTLMHLHDVRELSIDFGRRIVRINHSEGSAEFDLETITNIADAIHLKDHSITIS